LLSSESDRDQIHFSIKGNKLIMKVCIPLYYHGHKLVCTLTCLVLCVTHTYITQLEYPFALYKGTLSFKIK